jgi:hypothetical protein
VIAVRLAAGARALVSTLPFVLALVLAAGCAPADAGALADEAQQALGRRDYAAARAAALAGLELAADGRDPNLAWRLERLALEASAGLGDVDAILSALERLRVTHAAQADVQLHARVGNQLLESGSLDGAIAVVDAAYQRFPDDRAALEPLIAALQDRAIHGTDAEREKLATIPYLSGR